jgi:predicted HicB family RNase H-like nuclease
MKENIFEYKGYHTKIEFNAETFKLRGKIEGIRDLVNFESDSAREIEKEFHNAVDDYLEFCKEVGKEPEKEYRGTFNVRISPKLHRELAVMASKQNESLNQLVEKAIQEFVRGSSNTEIQLREIYRKLGNMDYNLLKLTPEREKTDRSINYGKYEIESINMQYQQ